MATSVPDIATVIEELSGRFLGRFGIVAISDADENGREIIEVFVAGDTAEAVESLPRSAAGFLIKVRRGGRIVPHAGS